MTSMEENTVRIASKQDMMQHWQENAPKIKFGEHQFSFELIDIDEFFIQKAKEELRETPEIVAPAYKELRELIAGESDLHVPDDEEFYTIFLRPCKWYAKSAFSLMKRHYRFRENYPHIFTNLMPDIQKFALYSCITYPLPLRTKDGCRILFIEIKQWKPKEVSAEEVFRTIILLTIFSTLEAKSQIAGTHVIIDAEGLSLSQVTYITPSFAKMVVDFAQTSLNIRLKGIHLVNQSFIFNIGFALFKPFIKEKYRKRIFIHGTNWESLMTSTSTDKSMLLMKHGGELEMPDESFGTALWQNMLSIEPALEVEQHRGYKTVKNKK